MPTNKPLENIKSRIIVSGNVVEITTYERGYFKNYHDAKKLVVLAKMQLMKINLLTVKKCCNVQGRACAVLRALTLN